MPRRFHRTLYEVRVPTPEGRWVRIGPLHDTMTAAELWAISRSYITDYVVTTAEEAD